MKDVEITFFEFSPVFLTVNYNRWGLVYREEPNQAPFFCNSFMWALFTEQSPEEYLKEIAKYHKEFTYFYICFFTDLPKDYAKDSFNQIIEYKKSQQQHLSALSAPDSEKESFGKIFLSYFSCI